MYEPELSKLVVHEIDGLHGSLRLARRAHH